MQALHRDALPQTTGAFLITDGGLETDLIFHHGYDLPAFASFPLVDNEAGRDQLRAYYRDYLAIAAEHGVGAVLEAPTWRANPDWGAQVGYALDPLESVNRRAIDLMVELRDEATGLPHVVISGQIGPRGDGYVVGSAMTADEARRYHSWQIGVFADTPADMVNIMTMNYVDEAIGATLAARDAQIPISVAFTVETDGTLPSGQSLGEAIAATDDATGGGPAYYMINCAHPTHFERVLEDGGSWTERIRGLRANASTMSHAELDEAEVLDEGDITELAAGHSRLAALLPALTVLGGCCGTDHRHVRAVASAWRVS
jgi:S-methylmethionine-dependent homocysteine/selenocysteine methylase